MKNTQPGRSVTKTCDCAARAAAATQSHEARLHARLSARPTAAATDPLQYWLDWLAFINFSVTKRPRQPDETDRPAAHAERQTADADVTVAGVTIGRG